MTIERLLKDRPMFHTWDDGSPVSFATSPRVLHFIFEHAKPNMTTLETGSGYSTVAFALAKTNHICITPSQEEPKKILQYCQQIGLQASIQFLTESSDAVLPKPGAIPAALDFVFIDGAHRFPYACVDFHYTGEKVKVGGILGVDDVDMPSVKVLYDFLQGEADWKLMERIKDTAFFQRVSLPNHVMDWTGQGMNQGYKKRKKLISSIKKTIKRFLPK